MSFDRPPLPLGRGPRGVHDARRWVAQACRDAGRPELVETAELAVSELVTNALLHAAPPIDVRLGGTPEHPRFEVRDGSTVPPDPPRRVEPVLDLDDAGPGSDDPDDDADPLDAFDPDALLTFGRGLSLVARASVAWGADVNETGKAVWFEPAADLADDGGAPCRITGVAGEADADNQPDGIEIVVPGVPVSTFLDFQRHYREVRREVRLLALAHEDEYPMARSLAEVFGSLDRPLRVGMGRRQVEEAQDAGQVVVDLRVRVQRDEAVGLDRLAEVLELADAFCRNERLLSLARSEEQEVFQRWFLGEFVRQAAGEQPSPWSHTWTAEDSGRRTSTG